METASQPPVDGVQVGAADPRVQVLDQFSDWKWRVSNLYHIQNDAGQDVIFRPNPEQLDLMDNAWYMSLILKARQLGITTLVSIMALDLCVFNSNQFAGVIAHNLEDAKKIFRRKVKYPYDNLPEQLRATVPLVSDSMSQMVFANGSEITVGTSMRSGTVQLLHVSEFGKICAEAPERAREIVTGAFNAVHQASGGMIFIESTAEGRGGYFFDYCMGALERQKAKVKETPMDFRLHFYPWFLKPEYRLDPEGVEIDDDHARYFLEKQLKDGIILDAAQRAWYVKKHAAMGDDMLREYPSTPEEAFSAPIKGAIYADEMLRLRASGRLGVYPLIPNIPVDSFWDLGTGTGCHLWVGQRVAGQYRMVKFHSAENKGIGYFVKWLQDLGAPIGTFYLPHDAEHAIHTVQQQTETVEEMVRRTMQGAKTVIVPRCKALIEGITLTRDALDEIIIDAEGCADGVAALESYRWTWNERLAQFTDEPVHNWCFTGDTKIITRRGLCEMSQLPPSGEVLTECGWRRYTNPRVTRRNAPVVAVAFSDGLTVRCTPDHTFKTDSGWKSAESLQTGMRIRSSLIRSRATSMAACTAYGRVTSTLRVAARSSTAWFGRALLAPFQTDAISITAMATPETTRYQTLSACRHMSTTATTLTARTARSAQQQGLGPSLGTSQRRAGSGISAMPSASRLGRNGSGKIAHAITAARRSAAWCALAKPISGIARTVARSLHTLREHVRKQPRIESVTVLSQRLDVWCITVPGAEEFSLSNGAIVHNCSHPSDAFRQYAQIKGEMTTGNGGMAQVKQMRARQNIGQRSWRVA